MNWQQVETLPPDNVAVYVKIEGWQREFAAFRTKTGGGNGWFVNGLPKRTKFPVKVVAWRPAEDES